MAKTYVGYHAGFIETIQRVGQFVEDLTVIIVKNEVLYFDEGIPSNFYTEAPIVMYSKFRDRELEFQGNEWYFQAEKVSCSHQGTYEMYDEIVYAPTAIEAKHLGRAVPLDTEELEIWNREAPVAMLECNIEKYTQHEFCRIWLVSTGNLRLVEHRRDSHWGDGLDGSGRNLLGKILEVVRALVR